MPSILVKHQVEEGRCDKRSDREERDQEDVLSREIAIASDENTPRDPCATTKPGGSHGCLGGAKRVGNVRQSLDVLDVPPRQEQASSLLNHPLGLLPADDGSAKFLLNVKRHVDMNEGQKPMLGTRIVEVVDLIDEEAQWHGCHGEQRHPTASELRPRQ